MKITRRNTKFFRAVLGLSLLTLAWAIAPAKYAGDPSAHILQADGGGVTLEFIPVYRPLEKIDGGGVVYSRALFEGAISSDPKSAGQPDLPEYSVPIRLAGLYDNTIEVLKTEYQDVPNVLLAPVPKYRGVGKVGKNNRKEIEYAPVYERNGKAYQSARFISGVHAYLTHVGETRGMFLANLRICPLQYNAAQKTLRKYTRIVVRVNFGERMAAHSRTDAMTAGIAINENQFKTAAVVPHAPRKTAAVNSVLATGVWYKFPITTEGMYEITGQTLLSLGIPAETDPATIKIYGNGGFELPGDPTAPATDDLLQNAVLVSDVDIPHHLDPQDNIIFYAKGTRGWQYDPVAKRFNHYINHFTETNYYWLTYGGAPARQMQASQVGISASIYQPSTATGLYFREDELTNLLGSGQNWLGQSFVVGQTITDVQTLPELDVTQPVNYTFNLGAQSEGYSTFTVSEHNAYLTSTTLDTVAVGTYSVQLSEQLSTASIIPAQVSSFTNQQSQLNFLFTSYNSAGIGYIDWYEIAYQRFLKAQNDLLSFYTSDTNAVTQYVATGFSGGQITAFDVSQFDSVLILGDATLSGDTCAFHVQLTHGSAKEIYVVGSNGYSSVSGFTRVANQNIHGDTTTATNFIITHSDFASAAQRLQSFHNTPGNEYVPTVVLDVNQVYNEFGGGLPMPAAIRNCLKYFYERANGDTATTPRYVLLFGRGDYDYRRIVATGPEWIPPWETQESFDPIASYAVEDSFVIFDASGRGSMGIGRLTSETIDDANTMVDKIIEYSTNPVIDPWKLQTTFVADDGYAGPGVDDGFVHTNDAEGIAATVPPLFNKDKIYLYAYTPVITSDGRRMPQVNQAIDNAINSGTLIMNFNGHGNPDLWCFEYVFVIETDFPLLHNKGKYFFLVAATCNYAYFDEIGIQSGAELLVSLPGAGAIEVVSADRAVYEGENYELNSALYSFMFQLANDGSILPQRFGDIMFKTKQVRTDVNDQKYLLIGDPALHLAFPKMYAVIDSVDHIANNQNIQLRALSNASFSATVLNSTSSPFDGTSFTQVFDVDKTVAISDVLDEGDGVFVPIAETFEIDGGVLFRGQENIVNNKMQANFIVPKDISYANSNGKINVYFSGEGVDGGAYTTNVVIGGTDSTAPHNTQGPKIQMYMNSRTFHSGDVVSANPTLIADLQDEYGINTSGGEVGHKLETWLDGATQSIDLTDYYKSSTGNFQQGTIEYQFLGISAGTHTLRLRAWDTYDNASIAEVIFSVLSSSGLQLTNVFNYPNPFSSSTLFTFQYNDLGNLNVQVKIYTVAGRLIRTLQQIGVSSHSNTVQIPWDGRDRDGSPIANGIYLYKIVARTLDSKFSSEAVGKLTVLK